MINHTANSNERTRWTAPVAILGLCFSLYVGCTSRTSANREPAPADATRNRTEPQRTDAKAGETRTGESKSADTQVREQIAKAEGEKRAELLKEAQAALEQTRLAIQALDKGDKKGALDALQQVTGKLDLIVSRDPNLAFAPVDVDTTILDLYATVDGVKAAVKQAKDSLGDNHVQDARHLISGLASEADINVAKLPLATYPAAIKAIAPLIDAGKTEEAKAALYTAINTVVIETYAIPLPRVRALAMLDMADKLAATKDRKEEDNRKLHDLIEAARHEIQLAETLGYGTRDDYKPLYAQLDDVQKKTEGGKSGTGWFRRMSDSLRNFKFLG